MSGPAKTKQERASPARRRRVEWAATLWVAIALEGGALAQGGAIANKNKPSIPKHCHVLNMMEWDLSEALRRCGDTARLFRPELFHSQRMDNLFASSARANEITTLFGQSGFGTRFSLDITGSYPAQENDVGGVLPKTKPPALGGAVRGGLIEDNTDDLGQPTVKGGQVAWSVIPSAAHGDDRISSVVGKLVINDSKVSLSLSVTPAEAGKGLIMTVRLSGEGGAECGIPRMRRTGDRSGEPLDMVARDRIDGEFLFISSADAHALQNIASAFQRGQWLDVPVRLNGGTSYTLTMELARPGHELFSRAFETWNLTPKRS